MPQAHNVTKDAFTFDQYPTARYLQRKHAEKLHDWTLADIQASVVRECDTPLIKNAAREAIEDCRNSDLGLKDLLIA